MNFVDGNRSVRVFLQRLYAYFRPKTSAFGLQFEPAQAQGKKEMIIGQTPNDRSWPGERHDSM